MIDPIIVIQYASNLLDVITDFVPKLITFATITAAFFPPCPGTWLSRLHVIINMVAFNFKEAKNKGTDL